MTSEFAEFVPWQSPLSQRLIGLDFYNWGAMGSAAMVGLGFALAQPARPVAVFTGDGEMLWGWERLPPSPSTGPATILVLDNEQYAETGMQKTARGFGTELAGVARACGLEARRSTRPRWTS